MKIVIAPDSYKGSLSAIEVSNIMKEAISTAIPEANLILNPMADGGEGTLESLVNATDGNCIPIQTIGPLGEIIQTQYGVLGDQQTAVIEIANICGLPIVPIEHRNPMNTTSFGVGEAILSAINNRYNRIIIGIGGSATNDGGLGMLQALGVSFFDEYGNIVLPTPSGLRKIKTINFDTMDQRIKDCEIIIACDVENPLCGTNGASYIFGPQKGATPQQLPELDSALKHYAELVENTLNKNFQNEPGAGAAGGLGFALLSIGAKIKPGAELVSSATGLSEKLKGATWVFTGEGQSDEQTLFGKVPSYVAKLAKENGCRAILISGSLGNGFEKLNELFTCCISTVLSPMTLETAMKQADKNLFESTLNIAKLIEGY